MPSRRTLAITTLAMLAFASNSILCRLALGPGSIDPASYTIVRMVSGAVALWLILKLAAGGEARNAGSWTGALSLLGYAVTFSYAYISLSAGIGALLLFGAVQATMIGIGIARGERMSAPQWLGLAIALVGLAALLAPGVSAPPALGSVLMISAGIAWGIYSLYGRGAGDTPLAATAGNFLRAAPLSMALVAAFAFVSPTLQSMGLLYAVLSGAISSGVGYALWYAALPGLTAIQGASVQLSVPVITAVAGALLLAEPLSWRLVLSSVAILGGIAIVITRKSRVA